MRVRNLLVVGTVGSLIAIGSHGQAQQVWQLRGGTTSVDLNRELVSAVGLEVTEVRQTAAPWHFMENAIGLAITQSTTLSFRSQSGRFEAWEGGSIVHQGGFTIRSGRSSVSLQNLVIDQVEDTYYLRSANNRTAVLKIGNPKRDFDRDRRTLGLLYADLTLTPAAARLLGRPDLGGQLIGMITIESRIELVGGLKDDPAPLGVSGDPESNNGNVFLNDVWNLTSLGRRSGAQFQYPNGISGLSMATDGCNVGTTNTNWFARMNENHPSISMNLYRVTDGVLEHIGVGWVKHGFFALNHNACGSCQHPGSGSLLGPNCSDIYDAGLNGSRTWLGPRNEINPFTGRWTCLGSFFANYQPDCVLRNSSSTTGPNGAYQGDDHRLRVRDGDLIPVAGVSSAIVYEAYYVSHNDIDRYNNIGWRRATANWTGSTWQFPTTSGKTMGPAIGMPGQVGGFFDMRAMAQPNSEGDFIVAAKVVSLGGGLWRYEYGVYNHTSDRKARRFTVSIPQGVSITNVGFNHPRIDGELPWSHTIGNGHITWETETYAQNPNANAIEWHSMYSFRFTANSTPGDTMAALQHFKPGALDMLSVETRGPGPVTSVMPTSFQVFRGQNQTGDLASLFFGDQAYVTAQPGITLSAQESPVEVIVNSNSPLAGPPTQMSFTFTGHASVANLGQRIFLYNFSTGQYDLLDERAATTANSTTTVNAVNPQQYVQVGTGAIRAKVAFRQLGPVVTFPWTARFDRTSWNIQ